MLTKEMSHCILMPEQAMPPAVIGCTPISIKKAPAWQLDPADLRMVRKIIFDDLDYILSGYESFQSRIKQWPKSMTSCRWKRTSIIYASPLTANRTASEQENCLLRLANASLAQRNHLEVAPSGFGIHWPKIDEDMAISPLLQPAETLGLKIVETNPQ